MSHKADNDAEISDSQAGSWHIRLDSLIDKRGWTNAELERRSGVSRKRIGEYRQGRSEPSATAMAQMARALDTTVEHLALGVADAASFPGASVAEGAQAALREAQARAFDPVYRPPPRPPGGEPTAYDRAALTLDAAYRRTGVEPSEGLRIALMSILIRHEITADELVLLLEAINLE